MKTITATVPAWLTGGGLMPHDEADNARAISDLTYWQPYEESSSPEGWVKVGNAKITVTFDDEKQVIASQVEVLNEAKRKLQADTQRRLNAIDEQISKLTCIEYKP